MAPIKTCLKAWLTLSIGYMDAPHEEKEKDSKPLHFAPRWRGHLDDNILTSSRDPPSICNTFSLSRKYDKVCLLSLNMSDDTAFSLFH